MIRQELKLNSNFKSGDEIFDVCFNKIVNSHLVG